jgi:tetratricopeptide (TPR) repeat protein
MKSEIERSRRKHPDNLAAYDLCLRALPHLYLPIPDGAKAAAPLLEEALRLDSNFAPAHAWLSRCHEISFMNGGFDLADRDAGIAHAEAVIASNTDDATALSVAGFNLWQLRQDYDIAVATIERALSHNPCCIWALTSGALVYAMGGDAARARAFADRSLRLSPFDPVAWGVHFVRTFVALIEGRPDEAVSHAVAAVHLHPHFGSLHAVHATALALAGRTEEGRAVARKAIQAFPAYNQGWIGHMVRDPALRETLLRGGKLAGLPE